MTDTYKYRNFTLFWLFVSIESTIPLKIIWI